MSYDDGAAIFMVGGHGTPGTVNPLKPQGYWLHDSLIVHVMQQGYRSVGGKEQPRLELWSGSGDKPYYAEGEVARAHHDQSGITKGGWRCVGAVKWHGGDTPPTVIFGDVPSRKIKHGVYK